MAARRWTADLARESIYLNTALDEDINVRPGAEEGEVEGEREEGRVRQRWKMDDRFSIVLVVILAIGGLMMMTALLACYVCIFRDLCCRSKNVYERRRRRRQQQQQQQQQRRRWSQPSPQRDPKSEPIPLNNITQEESMPTESEKV